MANPQLTDGHIRIANDLWRAAYNLLPAPEFRCWAVIVDYTYGWGKKMDWISAGQIAKALDCSTRTAKRYRKKLISWNVILTEESDEDVLYMGPNKDFESWRVIDQSSPSDNSDTGDKSDTGDIPDTGGSDKSDTGGSDNVDTGGGDKSDTHQNHDKSHDTTKGEPIAAAAITQPIGDMPESEAGDVAAASNSHLLEAYFRICGKQDALSANAEVAYRTVMTRIRSPEDMDLAVHALEAKHEHANRTEGKSRYRPFNYYSGFILDTLKDGKLAGGATGGKRKLANCGLL